MPKGINENVIRLMKDELSEKMMTEFAKLWPKTFNYLTDDKKENKKEKAQKRASWNLNWKFENII